MSAAAAAVDGPVIGEVWAAQLAGRAAAAAAVDVDQEERADELADLAAGVVLPLELQLGELRRQPFPCPACQLGGVNAEQRGMRITNQETGEVVFDSTPGGPDEETHR